MGSGHGASAKGGPKQQGQSAPQSASKWLLHVAIQRLPLDSPQLLHAAFHQLVPTTPFEASPLTISNLKYQTS